MMRPMKLAGEQLIFGSGCLEHLKTLNGSRALIVTGGSSMKKSGVLQTVIDYLEEAGMKSEVFAGVEPDPSFRTVFNGAEAMKKFQPDVIIGLGGGSAMDAAKAMRIYYEYPELTTLGHLPRIPYLIGRKAGFAFLHERHCQQVSRSVVITDNGLMLNTVS